MIPVLSELRHEKYKEEEINIIEWRMKRKLKTSNAVLVLCLNIGVDPPDQIKADPHPTNFCWIDPSSKQHKPIETIGLELKKQFERLQPRARYKQCLDPTVDMVKRTCIQLRNGAKKERVLFHYNGSGVPKVSENGEIWLFNKNYTQYIPLSIYDLHTWMKTPSLYVFDCSHAGLVIHHLIKIFEVEKKNNPLIADNIILGACETNEKLPSNPCFPADLFTSCLTTPIKTSLRWYCMTRELTRGIGDDVIENLPGKISDRRTPLGELNWIFTAITDTIAWSVLPQKLFHRLFRQDLLVASLFRNFLLANRIIRDGNCTPISYPKLPQTQFHPLWKSWDLALDLCISQLKETNKGAFSSGQFRGSRFFAGQLTEFEIWLTFGKDEVPSQLPMLLQVLLSQVHRLRALKLLLRFLKRGTASINLALCVGIFPYVLKLLQSHSVELKFVLVSIWSYLLSFDLSIQEDIVNDRGHLFFLKILNDKNLNDNIDLKILCCYNLSLIIHNYVDGQNACLRSPNLLSIIHSNLKNHKGEKFLQMLCLFLSQLIKENESAIEKAIQLGINDTLLNFLSQNNDCEFRATIIFTLRFFLHPKRSNDSTLENEMKIGIALFDFIHDGSPLVRKELLYVFSILIVTYIDKVPTSFLTQMFLKISNENKPKENEQKNKKESTFAQDLCRVLFMLISDPFQEVSTLANTIFEQIRSSFSKQEDVSPLSKGASFASQTFPQATSPTTTKLLNRLSIFKKKQKKPIGIPNLEIIFKDINKEELFNNLPKSEFFKYATKKFLKPKERVKRKKVVRILYQQQVEQQLENEARITMKTAGKTKLESELIFFGNEPDLVSQIQFHSNKTYLISANEYDKITVWQWVKPLKINSFKCQDVLKGRISDIKLVNQKFTNDLLLVASSSGNIGFYKSYYSKEKLVSALIAVPEANKKKTELGIGIICNWRQQKGNLIVSGDVQTIKIWDIHKEKCVESIKTDLDTCITCLSSDPNGGGNLFVAGSAQNDLLLIDEREGKIISKNKKTNNSCFMNAYIQKEDNYQLYTANSNGVVKLWDLRKGLAVTRNIETKSKINYFAVHNYSPIFAIATPKKIIKVYNVYGDYLSQIFYYEGLLGRRIGHVSALCFHPYKKFLSAGFTNSIISIYHSKPK